MPLIQFLTRSSQNTSFRHHENPSAALPFFSPAAGPGPRGSAPGKKKKPRPRRLGFTVKENCALRFTENLLRRHHDRLSPQRPTQQSSKGVEHRTLYHNLLPDLQRPKSCLQKGRWIRPGRVVFCGDLAQLQKVLDVRYPNRIYHRRPNKHPIIRADRRRSKSKRRRADPNINRNTQRGQPNRRRPNGRQIKHSIG